MESSRWTGSPEPSEETQKDGHVGLVLGTLLWFWVLLPLPACRCCYQVSQ